MHSDTFLLRFTKADLDQIGGALAKEPYGAVVGLVNNINQQLATPADPCATCTHALSTGACGHRAFFDQDVEGVAARQMAAKFGVCVLYNRKG